MPRIAYFPDSFHEINGVAHTSRQFEAFARRRNLPFLTIRAGDRTPRLLQEDNLWSLELPRGLLSFALEKDLRFDPAFLRHLPEIQDALDQFQPDLIHITGPSELGLLGAAVAHHRRLPLAASWHTNVHQYAARRAQWFLRLLPDDQARAAADTIEELAMKACASFYSQARVLFAPNLALCRQLQQATQRPCHLMPRGVDTALFHPQRRTRPASDGEFVLGYVGRLSVEKNIALLATLHDQLHDQLWQQLQQSGLALRFLIVGQGSEEGFLRHRLSNATFAGVLRGEALAAAYADMDLFVFPSHTDTFGNVVLEALASGVPALVTPNGGPASILGNSQAGCIAPDDAFAPAVADLLADPARLASMRHAARQRALQFTWDAVFEGVYAGYGRILPSAASHSPSSNAVTSLEPSTS